MAFAVSTVCLLIAAALSKVTTLFSNLAHTELAGKALVTCAGPIYDHTLVSVTVL
jgi:hypothetical protein